MINKNINVKKILFVTFFIAYMILLIKILFFKYISPIDFFEVDRLVIRNVNLVPFDSVNRYWAHFDMIGKANLIGNVVIFIPMGIFPKMIFEKKNSFLCIIYIFIISIVVEVIQFMFGIGITDIDDVLLNSIGGIIGVVSYDLLLKKLGDKNNVSTIILFIFSLVCIVSFVYLIYLNTHGYKVKIF